MFTELKLKDFMVFRKADFQFGEKLNIIIGENGSGKTQLLKLLFALDKIVNSGIRLRLTGTRGYIDYRTDEHPKQDEVNGPLKNIFKVSQTCDLIHFQEKNSKSAEYASITARFHDADKSFGFEIEIGKGNGDEFSYDTSGTTFLKRLADDCDCDCRSETLFFQARELLTIYKGYRSLNDRYDLPYDQSYSDTISKLGMPYLREIPTEYQKITNELGKAIKGKIYLENEQFRFRLEGMEKGKHDLDVNMAAEGWRKLAMLLQVLKNGELHKGMTLLWDEPDANLNPKLVCLLVNILIQLSKLGVQVFVTTHSLFMLRELDMLVKSEKSFAQGDVRFFNFPGKGNVEQGNSVEDLEKILLLEESLKQSDKYLEGDF